MNARDLHDLFARCPRKSPLYLVAQDALARLNASQNVRVVEGQPLPCEHYRKIYRARLDHLNERNLSVPGTEETVQVFEHCEGQLAGGYARTDDSHLIYFWTDEQGRLAGCVLSKETERSKP